MKPGSLVQLDPEKAKHSRDNNPPDPVTTRILKDAGYVYPELDTVYTVREIATHPDGTGILLEEIVNPKIRTIYGFLEVAWYIEPWVELQPPMSVEDVIGEYDPNVKEIEKQILVLT